MIKVILPMLIVGLLVSVQFTQATYGVSIGDEHVFDCVSAELNVTLGANSGGGTGYTVDGQHFAEGTSVTTNVTGFSFGVDYDIIAGGYTESSSSSTLGFVLGAVFMIIYPALIMYAYNSTTSWNQTAVDSDPGLLLIPFIENDTTVFDDFKDLADDVQSGTAVSTDTLGEVILNATYTDTTTEFYFESYFGGTLDINQTGTIFTAEIEHHFQFAYEKASGVMLGIRLAGNFDGTVNGTTLQLDYDQHTEQDGYNLPGYIFGGGWTWPFPAFGIIAAFTAIGSIAVLVIKRRK